MKLKHAITLKSLVQKLRDYLYFEATNQWCFPLIHWGQKFKEEKYII